MQVDLKDLQDAIAEYQKSHAETENQCLTLDPSKCSWEEVFKQMDAMKLRYDDKEDNGVGLLRRTWRQAGENAHKIDPWLYFIPDEYGLNFVRTGIVIILSVSYPHHS